MDTNAKCVECQRDTIPQRLWNAADKGDRDQWRREGKRAAWGGLCKPCYQIKWRATRKPKQAAPRLCHDCGTAAHSPKAMYCTECRDRRALEVLDRKREAAHAKRDRAREESDVAPIDRGSPDVLRDGRWVTSRGPSGFPVRVWQAA